MRDCMSIITRSHMTIILVLWCFQKGKFNQIILCITILVNFDYVLTTIHAERFVKEQRFVSCNETVWKLYWLTQSLESRSALLFPQFHVLNSTNVKQNKSFFKPSLLYEYPRQLLLPLCNFFARSPYCAKCYFNNLRLDKLTRPLLTIMHGEIIIFS